MADQWGAQGTERRERDTDAARVPGEPEGAALRQAFERPATVVLVVCQMLVGLGLALALILKVYMLVFSDLVCTADGATLGNMIRCTPTLAIMAQVIMLIAALRLAACLFSDVVTRLIEPLAIALAGALLALVAATADGAVAAGGPPWQAAILIVAVLVTGVATFAGLHFLGRPRR